MNTRRKIAKRVQRETEESELAAIMLGGGMLLDNEHVQDHILDDLMAIEAGEMDWDDDDLF